MKKATITGYEPHINSGQDYVKVKLELTLSMKEMRELCCLVKSSQIKVQLHKMED
jgi:hypothetical protein